MKNINKRLNDFSQKYGGLFMIVGILLSIGALVYSIYVANHPVMLPPKELTCTINYGQPLFIQTTKDNDFKILFKDNEVKNPFLYSITIENTGSEPILNEDFRNPLTIDFKGAEQVVKASLITSSNRGLWDEFLEKSNIQGTKLIIPNLFLNQKDTFTVNIITDGKADTIHYSHKITGIPELTVRNTPAEKRDHFNTTMIVMSIIYTICAVAIIALMVFAVIERIHYKKWRQEFNENYLKVLQMEESTHEPECKHQ